MSKLAKKMLGGSLALGLFSAIVPQTHAALVYGITEFSNTLISFDTSNTNDILSGVSIEGLANNDVIRALDFRPATGELYGLGSSSRIYKIAPDTGEATQVGSGRLSPLLNGSSFGFDFNPVVDRIRLTSNTDQNLRAHPDTGAVVFVDGSLRYNSSDVNSGDPNVVASAYTNSDTDTTTGTTLYNIDTVRDVLTIQNPPNDGGLQTVGPLGLDATDRLGFDILTVNGQNIAYAAITLATPVGSESASNLYEINLATGLATPIGRIGGGEFIRGIAVVVPEPASFSLLAAGATLLAGRRRRKA